MQNRIGNTIGLRTPLSQTLFVNGNECEINMFYHFKQGAITFHGGQVIVNFVPKFVAIATGSTGEKFK